MFGDKITLEHGLSLMSMENNQHLDGRLTTENLWRKMEAMITLIYIHCIG